MDEYLWYSAGFIAKLPKSQLLLIHQNKTKCINILYKLAWTTAQISRGSFLACISSGSVPRQHCKFGWFARDWTELSISSDDRLFGKLSCSILQPATVWYVRHLGNSVFVFPWWSSWGRSTKLQDSLWIPTHKIPLLVKCKSTVAFLTTINNKTYCIYS